MSDSDDAGGPSDSEYDSDDWDESTAWHLLKGSSKGPPLKKLGAAPVEEYFFKSQESLATVIDQNEDDDDEEIKSADVIVGINKSDDDVIAGINKSADVTMLRGQQSVDVADEKSEKKLFQRMSSV
jgi:hypothetical protein